MNQQERNEMVAGCVFTANAVTCRHVGVSGITDVMIKKHAEDKYEARVGVAIMGYVQDPDTVDILNDPFAHDFRENYCSGTGRTEEEAIKALERDMREMSRSLV